MVPSHHRRIEPRRVCQGPWHTSDRTEPERKQIDEQVRRAAYYIIAGKGATYFGIGSAVARIVDALLHDPRAILTICSRIQGVPDFEGVTLALPHLVGGEGALATIPLPLVAAEQTALRRRAAEHRLSRPHSWHAALF